MNQVFYVLSMSIVSHLFTFYLLFIKEASSLWLELHLAKQDSSQGEGNDIKKEECKMPFNGL